MNRLLHRIYAFLFGYFWLPCPICGHAFGGHEWNDGATIPAIAGGRVAICPDCARAGGGDAGNIVIWTDRPVDH